MNSHDNFFSQEIYLISNIYSLFLPIDVPGLHGHQARALAGGKSVLQAQ
jgi:hypothetical protein